MEKFNLKKAILENKATFFSSLNEGDLVKNIGKGLEYEATEEMIRDYAQHLMDEGSYDVEELAQSYLDIPRSFPRQLDYTFFKNNYDDILSVAMTGLGEGKKEYYKDAEADDAEHIDALEKDMADDKKSSKMKTSELKAKIKEMVLAEMALDVDNMEDAPESEVDFLAEVDAILAEADEFETAKPARITSFLKALDLLVYDEYHAELYDSDEVKQAYDLLVKAAKKLGNLNEAEEEVAVDDTEVAVDGEENIDVDTTTEVDPNVKAVQDALTQAQAAAQKLGDPKLTDQIGNTITFFTRAHVVDKGAVAEGQEDVASIGKKVEAAVEDKLEATVSKLSDDQKEQLKAELAKAGITADSKIEDVAGKLDESLYEAEGDTKAKVASALSDIGGGLMKSLLVPIIPVAIGSMGPGVVAGFAITAGTAGILIALAKALGAEKSMEEGKKEYYKDAEADDAEHINALEKDMKDDKDSSMKIKEVVFPMWQRIK